MLNEKSTYKVKIVGGFMDSANKSVITKESLEHESTHRKVEFLVNGKRVYALFPNNSTDVKTMAMIKEMLIKSYLSNYLDEK